MKNAQLKNSETSEKTVKPAKKQANWVEGSVGTSTALGTAAAEISQREKQDRAGREEVADGKREKGYYHGCQGQSGQ